MALKPDRNIVRDDISFYCFEAKERGYVAFAMTGVAQGPGLDSNTHRITFAPSTPSGAKPVGILAHDFASIDLTRQVPNRYKMEHPLGDKALIYTEGFITTNAIGPNQASGTLTYPIKAYAGTSGLLYSDANLGTISGWVSVGYFETARDLDGYARVFIDLPNTL